MSKLPVPTPAANATYDYFDIAEGTGIKAFYLAYTMKSTGVVGAPAVSGSILTTQAVYSAVKEIQRRETSGDVTQHKVMDEDFDLAPFNLPKTIKGTAYAQIPFLLDSTTSPQVCSGSLTVRLRKWDGTTETEITSGSSQWLSVADNNEIYALTLIPMTTITTPVHFAKGEQLRFTVEGWSLSNSPPAASDLWIGTDPQNRDGTKLTAAAGERTQSIVYIPFRLDDIN